MRLIDADELIKDRVSNDPVVIAAKYAPTVDVKLMGYGYWKKYTRSQYVGFDTYRDIVIYRCSGCGRETIIKTKFCPDCGAKMGFDKGSMQ